jgi:hypothetical protein
MATIRTQLVGSERRIITKVVNGQRRVSCSCCPSEGCCMYPADRLWLTGLGPTPEGFFTFDDLPDEVRVGADVIQKDVFNISGNSFNVYTDLSDPDERSIVWNIDELTPGGDCREQTGPNYTLGPDFGSSSPCCLIDNLQDVQDTFADTYQFDLGFSSNERERVALCVWGGGSLGYLAYYDGNDSFVKFFYNGPPHKWVYIVEALAQDEGGGVWEKDDPQNGPAGTYSPSTNVVNLYAGLGTVIVSEP